MTIANDTMGEPSIKHTDDCVIVNGNDFVKHDGYSHRIESLIYALHSIRDSLVDKEVKFVFGDGEPIKISSFETIVAHIKNQFDIKKLSIVLIDHTPLLSIDGVNIQLTHNYTFNTSKFLLRQEFLLNQAPYTFGIYFGRFSINRLLLAYFVENNANSIVGFRPGFDFVEFETRGLTDFFHNELTWLKNRLDLNTTLGSDNNDGQIHYSNALADYKNIWGNYRIEIISETNTHDTGWATEKTTKCLASGKPFILSGVQGQLEKLQSMGFKTFQPWIDESYDLEPDPHRRLELIKAEILRIENLNDKTQFFNEIDAIATHNRNIYKETVDRYYQTPLSQ